MKRVSQSLLFLIGIPLFALCQVGTEEEIQIGEHFAGGVVFYLDQHNENGLIAAPADQTEEEVRWGYNGTTNAISVGDGQYNMERILKFHDEYSKKGVSCAAEYCDTLSLGGFDDWYLPAIEELRKLYDNRDLVGNFMAGDYCSSTEYKFGDVYAIHFRPHKRIEHHYNKTSKKYFVRCIRKF